MGLLRPTAVQLGYKWANPAASTRHGHFPPGVLRALELRHRVGQQDVHVR